jgi:hypothetical protein
VFHGALAVYLARYLNLPSARLPGEEDDQLDHLPRDAEETRTALLEAFDRQRQVDMAGRLVARYLLLGHPPRALIGTLAHALLREDAGFHAYQMLEAGVRQFNDWGNGIAGRHILVAVPHLAVLLIRRDGPDPIWDRLTIWMTLRLTRRLRIFVVSR